MLREYGGDSLPFALLDHVVEIVKGPAQAVGQQTSHGGLACAHESDEHDAPRGIGFCGRAAHLLSLLRFRGLKPGKKLSHAARFKSCPDTYGGKEDFAGPRAALLLLYADFTTDGLKLNRR